MSTIQQQCVNTIRVLSAEGVQKANSGHPGLPLGAAPMAFELWANHMNHNPKNAKWDNRDRFVLSAGHGSMLVYSLLHLFGYGLGVEDLKQFRQWGSLTPGHPEFGHTIGVETTTGPLGAGFATAVGMAMAETHMAAKYNEEGFPIVDHYTYTIVGDGCLMEGITAEAASLAGTLALDKFIAFYDSNKISIEGSTDLAFTEDVAKRFEAYHFQVIKVEDGNDMAAIGAAIAAAKAEKSKPSLIIVSTQIGYGCPAKQGKASAHGEPLGADNVKATKENLGMPVDKDFYVSEEVRAYMEGIIEQGVKKEEEWNRLFASYKSQFPEKAGSYEKSIQNDIDMLALDSDEFWSFSDKPNATRNISGEVIQKLVKIIPNLFGGSADLAPSTKTWMNDQGEYSKENRLGKNIHFGVRELSMTAIGNGIALHGGLTTFTSTFFVFSDYMKPMVRLAALMGLPHTFVLTHDSIGVGEDGPTHQPIEQLASLRTIPNLVTFRPADAKEVAAAWYFAVSNKKQPTAIVLTRQNVGYYEKSGKEALKGAYVLVDSKKETPDMILMASGSEVGLVVDAAAKLKEEGIDARVVSVPSMELFEAQSSEYKESVLPNGVRKRMAVEAARSFGWDKYVGLDGKVLGIDHFGASAPANIVYEQFGLTAENVVKLAKEI
ncbi:MAG: transketolase [Vallitaleaceae bacterium]|nr:transketolase [Vallitaleaceae bacterium]